MCSFLSKNPLKENSDPSDEICSPGLRVTKSQLAAGSCDGNTQHESGPECLKGLTIPGLFHVIPTSQRWRMIFRTPKVHRVCSTQGTGVHWGWNDIFELFEQKSWVAIGNNTTPLITHSIKAICAKILSLWLVISCFQSTQSWKQGFFSSDSHCRSVVSEARSYLAQQFSFSSCRLGAQ